MSTTSHVGISLLPGADRLDIASSSREVIEIPNLDRGDAGRTRALGTEPPVRWDPGCPHDCPDDCPHARLQARHEIALLTHRDLADITDLEAARRRYVDERGASEPTLSLIALVARAVVIALTAFPRCNGGATGRAGASMQRRGCHLGIAVDTAGGRMVPVVGDAEHKSTRALAMEIEEAIARAHRGALVPADMGRSTFILADMASAGSDRSADDAAQAMLRPAAVAVLGLRQPRIHPVEWEGAVLERLYLPLSLTYDARVINKTDAARFTRAVAELLANPLRLLMAC